MNIKLTLSSILFLFLILLITPAITVVANSPGTKVTNDPIITRIIEKIEYFFAFKLEKKVAVLEKQAENRLIRAQDFATNGNHEKVQNQLQGYLVKKEEQNNLLKKIDEDEVLKKVQERTIEQQKTMEAIKTVISNDIKQDVIQTQEQVVNQVAQRVVEINGKEGQTEFFDKVEHVWAPGTGPGGGEAGVVYEGGAGHQYAPGTSAGGSGGVVYEGGAKIMFAPGTSAGSSGGDAKVDIKTVEVISN